MKNLICTVSVILFLILTLPAHQTLAATINVPADHATIQGAIDVAVDGDLVLVAPGDYLENIDFLGKAITLQSEAGAASTVIDGDRAGSVVTFAADESGASVLEGFTIRNGEGTYFKTDIAEWLVVGGGVFCDAASPTITRCTITENRADEGAGIFCFEASPAIVNGSISGNYAHGDGGGVACRNAASPAITRCSIRGNIAWSDGGGIACKSDSAPVVEVCSISGNSTVHSDGAGIFCDGAFPKITNCAITGNAAGESTPHGPTEDGGGIYCWNSSPVITNTTISENTAARAGGGIYVNGDWPASSILTITNCVLWGDASSLGPPEIYRVIGTPRITYSDIQGGGWEGAGNIVAYPYFVGGGDFHLAEVSPCIDAGNPDSSFNDVCFPPSMGTERNDMGAYGGPGACDWCGDRDGDGYDSAACGGADCDDNDSAIHPSAEEICDGRDTDCDGAVPDDEADEDQDGWMLCEGECEDLDPDVNPGAEEICDGFDWDCSGDPLDRDVDRDGFIDGDPACMGDDCDDDDPHSFPGAPELCDGRDNDCDGILPRDEIDGDGDGWPLCDDCDDEDPAVSPEAAEGSGAGNCDDGIDNDCDGLADKDPECAIVIHVSGDQPTIQAGIDAAPDGVLVLVAPGTYFENIDFRGKAVALRSEAGPSDTIIDGGQAGSVVVFSSGETKDSVIEGFTIRNGLNNVEPFSSGRGGGIYCYESSPTIAGCKIVNNQVRGSSGVGGGIYCSHASPLITDCTISDNRVSAYSGSAHGGGISCSSSTTIRNCTISGNTISGSIAAAFDSSFYLSASGAGIYCGGSPTIENCIITGNSGSQVGAGIHCAPGSAATITNCTISENATSGFYMDGSGGGIDSRGASPTITNCIVWGNEARISPEICVVEEWSGSVGTPTVTYSDVLGGWPGEGNIDADPLFIGAGDCHLRPGSPCIDVGTDLGVHIDIDGDARPFGAGFDIGADEYTGPRWALGLDAAYEAGSVSLDYVIWTPEPAGWVIALILTQPSVQVIPLPTLPLPALETPADIPIALPFPSIGMVGFYSGLYSTEGREVSDLDWVDTGS